MNVVALVTLYFPQDNVVVNMKKLSKQVSTIILIDNTPNNDNRNLFNVIKNSIYIANNQNLGLASAFNKGLSIDKARESDYVVFFDQDSAIPNGLVSQLVSDFELLNLNNKIGCIGPAYYDTNEKIKKIPKDRKELQNNIFAVKNIITSSMLSKYNILKEINFWNEKIFLDLSDWDICWRLRERKYLICLSLNTELTHTLGDSIKKVLWLSIRKSGAVREYYSIRDSIKLIGKKYTPFKYKLRFIFTWTIMPIIYLTFLPKRSERLRYILRGFYDGLTGIDGEFKKK